MGRNDNGVQKAIQKIGVTALYGARRVSIVPKSSKNLFIWLYIWLNGHVRRTGQLILDTKANRQGHGAVEN